MPEYRLPATTLDPATILGAYPLAFDALKSGGWVYDQQRGLVIEDAVYDSLDAATKAEVEAWRASLGLVDDATIEDVAARRATVVADLQAMRDATTLAGFRGPLLRVLIFLLRRVGEGAS